MFLGGSLEHSKQPFLAHFETMRKDTNDGDIYCINLVRGSDNANEVMLKNRYEELVNDC
jgi:hypothetical protein